MSDDESELTELAAKAHGNCKYFNDAWRCAETGYREFNPIYDDGDAIRLAVKLKLKIEILDTVTNVYFGNDESCVSCLHQNDALLSTRLAIVASAAEIGNNL